MPERASWIPGQPPPACDAVASLPANLATALVLLDYAAHGLTTPTPWPQAAVRALPAGALARLERLRVVLAHGTVLREFLLDRIGPAHPAQRDWPSLHRWLEGLPEAAVGELVADGILLGLAYYREEMEPLPDVEAELRHLGTRAPDRGLLEDAGARRAALRALLLSWGAPPAGEPLELALEPGRFRRELVDLLAAVWEGAFAAAWEEGSVRVEEAVLRARGQLATGPPRAAADRILEVTGLQPPLELEGPLRAATHLLFVPCLHLGRHLSLTRAGVGWAPLRFGPDRFRVFFEPAPGRADGEAAPARAAQVLELGHLGPALAALGDATRLAMLQVLRREGELPAGRLAAALRLHPSTASRHLARLEAAGLVRVRREGSAKYVRLDAGRLRALARLLEEALGP